MVAEIRPTELEAALDSEDVRVVDIRSAASFRRGHIPGSENVPVPELATVADRLVDADRVVTVCPHGRDSLRAARLVNSVDGSTGTPVQSLAGGLEAWTGPLETGPADERDGDTDGSAAPF